MVCVPTCNTHGNIQILQVATRERDVCDDLNLSIADLRDGHVVTEVVGAALDLDAIVQEFLERRQVEDLVADGLAGVDDVLLWSATCCGIRGTMRAKGLPSW